MATVAIERREDAFVERDDAAHALAGGAALRLEGLHDTRTAEAREEVRGRSALSADEDELEAPGRRRAARVLRRGLTLRRPARAAVRLASRSVALFPF
jgi:hypothetical protein